MEVRIFLPLLVACLILVSSAAAQTGAITVGVNETVFILDSQGPSYVPGAKVTLSGESRLSRTQTRKGVVIPRGQDKYLVEARIWLDATDALVWAEGKPALNPPFWTRSVHVVQQYQKKGILAANRKLRAFDIGDAVWQDVDTLEALEFGSNIQLEPFSPVTSEGARV